VPLELFAVILLVVSSKRIFECVVKLSKSISAAYVLVKLYKSMSVVNGIVKFSKSIPRLQVSLLFQSNKSLYKTDVHQIYFIPHL